MITNMKFQNLCTEIKTPPKIGRLLKSNLPFCLEYPLLDQNIAKIMENIEKRHPTENMATSYYGRPPS